FVEWKDTLKWVFDAVAFMLVGMLLYRVGWLQAEASRRTYLCLILIGYGFGLPIKAVGAFADWRLFMGSGSPQFWQFWLPAITIFNGSVRMDLAISHLRPPACARSKSTTAATCGLAGEREFGHARRRERLCGRLQRRRGDHAFITGEQIGEMLVHGPDVAGASGGGALQLGSPIDEPLERALERALASSPIQGADMRR